MGGSVILLFERCERIISGNKQVDARKRKFCEDLHPFYCDRNRRTRLDALGSVTHFTCEHAAAMELGNGISGRKILFALRVWNYLGGESHEIHDAQRKLAREDRESGILIAIHLHPGNFCGAGHKLKAKHGNVGEEQVTEVSGSSDIGSEALEAGMRRS